MEKQCQKKIKEKGPKAKTHSSPAGGYAAEAGVFCFNFDKAHFEMASEVNEKIKKDGFAEIAPHEMSAGNASVNNLFNWIDIKLTNDPNKHRKIVVLD